MLVAPLVQYKGVVKVSTTVLMLFLILVFNGWFATCPRADYPLQ
jgi:hypothetical protein